MKHAPPPSQLISCLLSISFLLLSVESAFSSEITGGPGFARFYSGILADDFSEPYATRWHQVKLTSGVGAINTIEQKDGQLVINAISQADGPDDYFAESRAALTRPFFIHESFHAQIDIGFKEGTFGEFLSGLAIINPLETEPTATIVGIGTSLLGELSETVYPFSNLGGLIEPDLTNPRALNLEEAITVTLDYDAVTQTLIASVPSLGYSRMAVLSSYTSGFILMLHTIAFNYSQDGLIHNSGVSGFFDNLSSDLEVITWAVSKTPLSINGELYNQTWLGAEVLGIDADEPGDAVYFATGGFPPVSKVTVDDTWVQLNGQNHLNAFLLSESERRYTLYSYATSTEIIQILPVGTQLDAYFPGIFLAQGIGRDYLWNTSQDPLELSRVDEFPCEEDPVVPSHVCSFYRQFQQEYSSWSGISDAKGVFWGVFGNATTFPVGDVPVVEPALIPNAEPAVILSPITYSQSSASTALLFVESISVGDRYLSFFQQDALAVAGLAHVLKTNGMRNSQGTFYVRETLVGHSPNGLESVLAIEEQILDTTGCSTNSELTAQGPCLYIPYAINISAPVSLSMAEGKWQGRVLVEFFSSNHRVIQTLEVSADFLVDHSPPIATLITPANGTVIDTGVGQIVQIALAEVGLFPSGISGTTVSLSVNGSVPDSLQVTEDLVSFVLDSTMSESHKFGVSLVISDFSGNTNHSFWELYPVSSGFGEIQQKAYGFIEVIRPLLQLEPDHLHLFAVQGIYAAPPAMNAITASNEEEPLVEIFDDSISVHLQQLAPDGTPILGAGIRVNLNSWGQITSLFSSVVTNSIQGGDNLLTEEEARVLFYEKIVELNLAPLGGAIDKLSKAWASNPDGSLRPVFITLVNGAGSTEIVIDRVTGEITANSLSINAITIEGKWVAIVSEGSRHGDENGLAKTTSASDWGYEEFDCDGSSFTSGDCLGSPWLRPKNMQVPWRNDARYLFANPSQGLEGVTALKWNGDLNGILNANIGIQEMSHQSIYFRQDVIKVCDAETAAACAGPTKSTGKTSTIYYYGTYDNCNYFSGLGCAAYPELVIHETSHGILYSMGIVGSYYGSLHEGVAFATECLFVGGCAAGSTYPSPGDIFKDDTHERGGPIAYALNDVGIRLRAHNPTGTAREGLYLAWASIRDTQFSSNDPYYGRLLAGIAVKVRGGLTSLSSTKYEQFLADVQWAFAIQRIPVLGESSMAPSVAPVIGITFTPDYIINDDTHFLPRLKFGSNLSLSDFFIGNTLGIRALVARNRSLGGRVKLWLYLKDPEVEKVSACGVLDSVLDDGEYRPHFAQFRSLSVSNQITKCVTKSTNEGQSCSHKIYFRAAHYDANSNVLVSTSTLQQEAPFFIIKDSSTCLPNPFKFNLASLCSQGKGGEADVALLILTLAFVYSRRRAHAR